MLNDGFVCDFWQSINCHACMSSCVFFKNHRRGWCQWNKPKAYELHLYRARESKFVLPEIIWHYCFFELSLSRHRSLNNSCGLNPRLEFSGLHYCLFVKERGDHSPNGEGGIWTLAPLLTTCTLSRGVPSTSWVLLHISWINKFYLVTRGLPLSLERREWDSNPRALADKRFSRPPRYDHFDISPSVAVFHAAKVILAKTSPPVNIFFKFFRHFCKFNFSHRLFASLFPCFSLAARTSDIVYCG